MKESLLAVALTFALAAAVQGESSAAIGLVPSDDPAVTESLTHGARLALEHAASMNGLEIELVVGSSPTHWATASTPTVELAFGSDVLAVLTPPDRRTAHLVAQIGSRAHIPVLATTAARSIGGTGSYWVIPLVPLASESLRPSRAPLEVDLSDPQTAALDSAFRHRFGREMDGWAVVGYRAAEAVCEAVRRHGTDRHRLVRSLQSIAAD